MNKESLMLFIQRILKNGSEKKSSLALQQLKEILEIQGAEQEMIDLVALTLTAIPEAKDASFYSSFSEESLKIAAERAVDRKRREEAMRSMGRC